MTLTAQRIQCEICNAYIGHGVATRRCGVHKKTPMPERMEPFAERLFTRLTNEATSAQLDEAFTDEEDLRAALATEFINMLHEDLYAWATSLRNHAVLTLELRGMIHAAEALAGLLDNVGEWQWGALHRVKDIDAPDS